MRLLPLLLIGCGSGTAVITGPADTADTAAPVDTGPLPFDPIAPLVHIVLVLDSHDSNDANRAALDLELDGYGAALATWAVLEVGETAHYRRIDPVDPLPAGVPVPSPPLIDAIERVQTQEPTPVVWLVVSERDSAGAWVPGMLPADHTIATWRSGLPNIDDAVTSTGGVDCAGTLDCFGSWPW